MGLWNLFSGKKNKKDGEETETSQPIKKAAKITQRINTKAERSEYIKENCEQIAECSRQIEEAKTEYQAVTSYLTDMQKIDLIPLEQRGNMEDAARSIFNLTKERNKLQNRSTILTDKQFRLFEQYELQIPKDMTLIEDSEKYQSVISRDITYLESERKSLDDEQEDVINKQAFLKGIAVIISGVVVFLFLLFAFLSTSTDGNYTIPFLLTVLLGMVSAVYIFMEARKNISEVRLIQMKQNRQVILMNKVKIKSVNNRNYLDYEYSKYNISGSEQLKIFWEEYVRLKDENRRYQNNTQLLEFYNNELIHELKKFGVADSEIWIFQPSAILDDKEMVEVRHRLNVRRQKLRERIDLNSKQKDDAENAVRSVMNSYPDCLEEAGRILRRYRIQLED